MRYTLGSEALDTHVGTVVATSVQNLIGTLTREGCMEALVRLGVDQKDCLGTWPSTGSSGLYRIYRVGPQMSEN